MLDATKLTIVNMFYAINNEYNYLFSDNEFDSLNSETLNEFPLTG